MKLELEIDDDLIEPIEAMAQTLNLTFNQMVVGLIKVGMPALVIMKEERIADASQCVIDLLDRTCDRKATS